jgi:hypothetical protein
MDGVMRSGGWGPKKATVCQPSASTGATVLLLETALTCPTARLLHSSAGSLMRFCDQAVGA